MCRFWILLFYLLGFSVYCQSQEWGCTTPNRARGTCTPLRQCAPMLRAIRQIGRPIPKTVSEKIKRFVCNNNYYNRGVNVCCPNKPINLQSDWIYEDDEGSCNTPTGARGTCTPVRQCRPMLEALRNVKRPVPQSVTEEVNRYVCSYSNGVTNVCCPNGVIVLHSDDGQPPPAPDVSHHRNLYLLPSECGYLDPTGDKVRNGKDADLNEFPWMALLSYRTRRGPQFKCGATIINEHYILTAAHCIKNTESPLLGVRIGEYNIATKNDCQKQLDGTTKCTAGVQDLAIEELIPHPQFNLTTIANDIGLIRVSRMNLNLENARPVCLPQGELKDDKLDNVIVTGWGVVDITTGQSAQILQKVGLKVVDLETCKNAYKKQSRAHLTYKQVCAGGRNNQDSCPGDSGGPLHSASFYNDAPRYIQQGIVSFGPRECGLEGYPGVYTRVAYYMDWILDNIRP